MENNPEESPLFGGLTGAQLGTDEFEICEGLVVRRTYAHLMSPYILAFARPEGPGKPHPGPWRPARGGQSLDLEIEVALRRGRTPHRFRPTKYPMVGTRTVTAIDWCELEDADPVRHVFVWYEGCAGGSRHLAGRDATSATANRIRSTEGDRQEPFAVGTAGVCLRRQAHE